MKTEIEIPQQYRSKRLTEMKNVFDGLLSRLDMTEESSSKFQDMSVETHETEKQGFKKKKLENEREHHINK